MVIVLRQSWCIRGSNEAVCLVIVAHSVCMESFFSLGLGIVSLCIRRELLQEGQLGCVWPGLYVHFLCNFCRDGLCLVY